MKTLFIEARYKGKINLSGLEKGSLPEKLGLFTTVQYLDFIPQIKKALESKGKKVFLYKPKNAAYDGQLLGCSISEMPEYKGADAFLYFGDGLFHPTALAIKNKKPVFIINPFSGRITEVTKTDIERMEKQKISALAKFRSSQNIGVLVSTKPGQKNILAVEKLRMKYPQKNFYLLLFDTLDFTQLENFTFIGCFVNTACPRISYDDFTSFPKPAVDFHEIL